MHLRPARSGDEPALTEICLRTGHRGHDARGVYTMPDLLAAMYLRPYLELELPWCFVGEDNDGPAGYLVGTPDTRAFARAAEASCWPPLRTQHPLPVSTDTSPQAQLVRALHRGTPTELPFIDSHPAHLHIDLLPRVQRQGHGARLLARFIAALISGGVPGVHLGVSAHNPEAIMFYRRLGFETLQDADWGQWMGRHC